MWQNNPNRMNQMYQSQLDDLEEKFAKINSLFQNGSITKVKYSQYMKNLNRKKDYLLSKLNNK